MFCSIDLPEETYVSCFLAGRLDGFFAQRRQPKDFEVVDSLSQKEFEERELFYLVLLKVFLWFIVVFWCFWRFS